MILSLFCSGFWTLPSSLPLFSKYWFSSIVNNKNQKTSLDNEPDLYLFLIINNKTQYALNIFQSAENKKPKQKINFIFITANLLIRNKKHITLQFNLHHKEVFYYHKNLISHSRVPKLISFCNIFVCFFFILNFFFKEKKV